MDVPTLQMECTSLESEYFRITCQLMAGAFHEDRKWKPWERAKLEARLEECQEELQVKRLQLLNSWLVNCGKSKLSWIPKGGYNVF